MLDYTVFYKDAWRFEDWPGHEGWDVFLSAFNSSDRVQQVFNKATASQKHWLIAREYQYQEDEFPSTGRCVVAQSEFEADVIKGYFTETAVSPGDIRLCVDITGFMRPHLLFLLRFLAENGVRTFDVIYSEPGHYEKAEKTRFSDEVVVDIRQIAGFEGNHVTDTSSDVLVIGAGYDDKLIAHVAEHKDSAKKVRILGLPSLRADMYQQNVLRAELAAEQVGGHALDGIDTHFAPANDPFVTAESISCVVRKMRDRKAISNLYLSPLATKVQALGFGLYYLFECVGQPVSVVFPFCRRYSRETSKGISRVWRYRIELPHRP